MKELLDQFWCERVIDHTTVRASIGGEIIGVGVVRCHLEAAAVRNGELVCVHHWLTDDRDVPPGWSTLPRLTGHGDQFTIWDQILRHRATRIVDESVEPEPPELVEPKLRHFECPLCGRDRTVVHERDGCIGAQRTSMRRPGPAGRAATTLRGADPMPEGKVEVNARWVAYQTYGAYPRGTLVIIIEVADHQVEVIEPVSGSRWRLPVDEFRRQYHPERRADPTHWTR